MRRCGEFVEPTDEMNDVSIILALRDGRRVCAAGLPSALAQIGVTFDVVAVHGGTLEYETELELAVREEPVTVVSAPGDAAPALAMNLGVRAARGRWLAFLNEADLWAPEHLSTLVAACERERAAFGYCAWWGVDGEDRIVSFQAVPAADDLSRELLEHDAIGTPSCVVALHSLWDRAGGFDEWLSILAPWDLWIRWSRIAHACMLPVPTVAVAEAPAPPPDEFECELRELRRRYEADARQAGVRFGAGPRHHAPRAAQRARLPWLTSEARVGRRRRR
jgi:hypothetical protein